MAQPVEPATTASSNKGNSKGNTELRRVVYGSVVGTALEWYDFFIYGTASALVFGQLFFST